MLKQMQLLTTEPSMTRTRAGRQYKEEVMTVVVKYRLDLISLVHIAKVIGRAPLHSLPSSVTMPMFPFARLTNMTMIN